MADSTTAAAPASTTHTTQATTSQPGQAPAASQQAPQTHKIKVDGQEMELPLSELINLAQQGKGASKRFEEAAKTRREAEQLIQFAKANPKEFFAKTGMNAREWAENYLMEEIQREAMSPEQKKAWENEQKLRDYEGKEKAAKDKAQQEQMQALERQHMENYNKMFIEALSASGLPKTPFTVMRMAQLTLSAEKNKIPVNPAQIAKIVREDYIAEQKALFGAADGDALLEMLGKDVIKKLSKAQLSKYKASKLNNASPPKSTQQPDKKAPSRDWKQFTKKNRSFI